MHTAIERHVPTTTLADLLAKFGIPYFAKCDIEGSDAVFVRQLSTASEKPAFVSIEAMSTSDLAVLYASGYDCFQIVNQQFINWSRPPNPALEGQFVEMPFTAHMSGLFGRELPMQHWIEFSEAAYRFEMWSRLHRIDEMLAPGWLDFHATTRATLDRAP